MGAATAGGSGRLRKSLGSIGRRTIGGTRLPGFWREGVTTPVGAGWPPTMLRTVGMGCAVPGIIVPVVGPCTGPLGICAGIGATPEGTTPPTTGGCIAPPFTL